ncbi:MAG: SRPBCC domain-containing protein [Rhodoglobus sp.]
MGMKTHAAVDIAAPIATVFAWLTEPKKLVAWMGASGAMPNDTSLLKPGFTATAPMPTPGQTRESTLTVTEISPPRSFAFTIAYDGGDSITKYTLSQTGAVTHLEIDADTDWAAPDLSKVEENLEGQSWVIRAFVHHQLTVAEHKLADGGFDAQTQPYLQAALQQSMDKLKTVIEGGSVA